MARKIKKNCPQQAEPSIEIIQGELFFEIEKGKRDKNREAYEFLENFKLPNGHHLVADTIGWHLEQILKKGNAPTD